jgi:hypothetical protein
MYHRKEDICVEVQSLADFRAGKRKTLDVIVCDHKIEFTPPLKQYDHYISVYKDGDSYFPVQVKTSLPAK